MKPKVIALIGPQGCGKSTLANYQYYRSVIMDRFSFADPIRAMLYPIVADELEIDCSEPDALMDIDKSAPIDSLGGKSYRQAAQTLGTEWGRRLISKDIWVNHMKNRLINHPWHVCIDDARFIDEFTMLREETDLLLLRINRDDIPDQANDHESEHYWAKQEPDGVIDNNGTLEESIAQIEKAIANKWGVE